MLSDRPRLWGGAATMPCTNHPRSSDSCYVLVSFLPEKKQLYAYVCSRHTFAHVARSNRPCSPPASLYAISNAVTHTPTIYIYKLSTPIVVSSSIHQHAKQRSLRQSRCWWIQRNHLRSDDGSFNFHRPRQAWLRLLEC